METNAKIVICSEIRGEDGAWQRSFYTAAGEAAFESESWRVEYDEPEQTGMEGVHTVLRLNKDRAELERAGSVHCALCFSSGSAHESVYETLYGAFPVTVTTRRLLSHRSMSGAVLELHYTMLLGGAEDEHRLRVMVSKPEGTVVNDE